jgi:UDP-N-acetyl-D-glucosamine dehydrogenase
MGEVGGLRMKVCVIGQGYVGLPLAIEAVKAGHVVVGLDVAANRVAALLRRESFTSDVCSSELQAAFETGRYTVSTDPEAISDFDIAIITVPTPLKNGAPDLSYVENASVTVGKYLRAGATVVLESTSYPGTTEQVVLPLLEKWSQLSIFDFHLGFSPERIDPGNKHWRLHNTPKLVSGLAPCCLDAVDGFYRTVVRTTVRTSSLVTAELAKIVENTFRHVNIALVNEMAMTAEALGISIWDVLDAADTKPYGFMKFTPGPGVGGHCLPVDPAYLSWQVERELGQPFRFIELANDVNFHMPHHVVDRAARMLNAGRKSVNGSKVLVLGLAYKAGTADVRESPSFKVIELLQRRGAIVSLADPWAEPAGFPVQEWTGADGPISDFDLVVLLTDHAEFDDRLVADAALVLDCRNHLSPASHVQTI